MKKEDFYKISHKFKVISEKKRQFRLNPLKVSGKVRKMFYRPKNPYKV